MSFLGDLEKKVPAFRRSFFAEVFFFADVFFR